jgi:PAS domain S-box-containing protein
MPLSLIASPPQPLPWSGWFNRDLIENMPVAVYVCDADGVLVAYNRKASDLWGVAPVLGDTQQKFCGAHRLYLSDGTFVPHHLTPLATVLQTRAPCAFEAMVGRPDGSLRNVAANVAPLFDDNRVFMGFVNCVLDITDSKRATESRDRMWRLSQDLMVVARLDGTITAANPACVATLGWSMDELVGCRVHSVVHPEDLPAFLDHWQLLVLGKKLPAFENRCAGKDGDYRWVSWHAVTEAGLIHAVARDVTERKLRDRALEAAEDALRQSQKMEAIGLLTGGVAHDFNNLLTVIRGSADILKLPDLPHERRQRYISAIAETADRGARLTSQLLAFSRRQALKPEAFDAGAGLLSVADMLATLTGARMKIELDLPERPCLVHADHSQLDTAIVNLVANARDACAGSGVITIAVAAVGCLPALRGHDARAGDYIAISVTDTGAGIAADILLRVFEPFFTTKKMGEGTGLGLSQVIGFTKQSGGDVEIDSSPGAGTTVTLYLPQYHGELAPRDDTVAPQALGDGQGKRVLIVEDNAEVGAFAHEMLQDLGYAVTLVDDAEKALAVLADAHGAFCAVFSDIEMPGMNGVELAGRIAQRFPALPVLMTSGYNHAHFRDGAPHDGLLLKPYSIRQLEQALQQVIARKTLRAVSGRLHATA